MRPLRIGIFGLTILLLLAASMFIFPLPVPAQPDQKWVARAVSIQGIVEARRAGKEVWEPVRLNDPIYLGDSVRVRERSRAELSLLNDTFVRLDQNSTIVFPAPEDERPILLKLLQGIAHFFSRTSRRIEVVTPFVNATVEGTEFVLRVEGDKATVTVLEGTVAALNNAGAVSLASGESASAQAGQAPAKSLAARPRDSVIWALYYPPVLYHRLSDFAPGSPGDWRSEVRRSIESYLKGDVVNALEIVQSLPQDVKEPLLYTYRASLLLTVGRVDEARSDLEKALALSPGVGSALSLQAVIAVVQNDKERALELARKAAREEPATAASRIALSYALQAVFDLKGARSSLSEAVRLDPDNALAWARLSEIELSLGDLEEARKAARRASDLRPDLSRTKTVLGFAHLAEIRIADSRAAFEEAVTLDQADPLPRLGLGLAMIRSGDLAQGRAQIEIAASLDPNNSLLRSYLGKAYYEEKRDHPASQQFMLAEGLDPMDPTPYLYDAIRKEGINRPVEALHDLQKSIELNDNRAVYRSRLLLDQDLAAKSADLARIYTDLGFGQLAMVEAWKSLDVNPADYSAHRFLADSYASLPRRDIARVSEILQAHLLQPINISPVQPEMADSNLLIPVGAGPADPSFNEFTPLFNRNRLALLAGGLWGENSTLGEEVVLSGVSGGLSFSLGQFHYETDGYRENNNLNKNIYDLFAQYSLTYRTSVQAEFRATRAEQGDIQLNYGEDNFSTSLRQEEDPESIRLGIRHSFSTDADLLVSFIYNDVDSGLEQSTPFFNLGVDSDMRSFGGEMQFILRWERSYFIFGGGRFETEREDTIETTIPDLPIPPQEAVARTDVEHTNLYLYHQFNVLRPVTFTLGASGDFFRGGSVDRDQFNPKAGVIWNPFASTTVRAAAFRTLKRTLATDQTLEPTRVAGFNQFFDDGEATQAWNYGAAVDQVFSPDLHGGLEYYRRDLTVPYDRVTLPEDPSQPPVVEALDADWMEGQGRAYLYWTPSRWVALSLEYLHEEFQREREFCTGVLDLTTQRLPIGIQFFHPSGFSAGLQGTYLDQEGTFQSLSGEFFDGSDHFWLLDAAVRYRLPKRLGILSLEGRNLLDEDFLFQDMDPANPVIQPDRMLMMKLTLAF